MPEQGAAVITPKPADGRVYEAARRIRLGDVDPTGRCRLDAAVRYLQDVARDDSADSGLTEPMNWVVRRVMLEVHQAPVFQEWIRLATWCSGHGARWAERRTEVKGDHGAHVEATTVWIFVDGVTGAPKPLHADFFAIYGATAAGRRVSARQRLKAGPPDHVEAEPWPLRFTDLDLLGHVNNAAQWSPLEEAVSRVGAPTEGIRAELEHGVGIERGAVTFHWRGIDGGVDSWLYTEAGLGSAGRIRPL
jgi:acyl-ACP thioesterase